MSSVQIDLGPNPAEYIWINTLINLSATVMLYYEYMLTLSREIQFLWPPHNKLGWFTFSCLLNRYLPLFGHIPIFLPYLITASSDFCEGLHVYDEWFVLGVQAQANLLVLLRVYALYDRSRRILGVLMLLGVVDFITAVSTLFVSRHGGNVIPVTSSFPGCSQYMPPLGGRFAAIPWMGVLIYDCGVFCLTLYKAVTMGRGIKLLNVIVRDGTMYFSALFVINLVNILTLWFAPPLLRTSATIVTNVLSTTLVSRLVLNLREQNSSLTGFPTSLETQRRFQAGLPVAGQPVVSAENLSFVRPNGSVRRTTTMGTT